MAIKYTKERSGAAGVKIKPAADAEAIAEMIKTRCPEAYAKYLAEQEAEMKAKLDELQKQLAKHRADRDAKDWLNGLVSTIQGSITEPWKCRHQVQDYVARFRMRGGSASKPY